ncbi:FAD-dependent oxidoreductase [Deinococcus koreensis]|nr:FAD-dependent oxidoreductase [Deinococcus koreensis]
MSLEKPPAQPGQVWAHVGQPFVGREYDLIVLGAGRMGAACALYLRRLAPRRSLLLIEEGGLPNEDGATLLSPGVWSALTVPPERRAEAQWTRAQLAGALAPDPSLNLSFQARPLLELAAAGGAGWEAVLDVLGRDPAPTLPAGLADLQALPWARLDAQAARYRPGALALACAQAAIGAGADLMLNARAHLDGGGVGIERLSVTNTHQIVVHETHRLRAGRVVVALGAAGPGTVEHDLGLHTTHARAYRQFPRLNHPSTEQTPTLRAAGLTLRPQHGGFTLVPAIHHRDPAGYEPGGGRLTGVPTGLRRETLEDLVAAMDALPALATGALELGRSLMDVPGAWFALPGGDPDGLPRHEEVAPGVHLLLGGPHADTLGLAVAYDLAATVAGTQQRPWAGRPG